MHRAPPKAAADQDRIDLNGIDLLNPGHDLFHMHRMINIIGGGGGSIGGKNRRDSDGR
jgi:hypothetical protein